jgi:hypothetical protein
MGRLIIFLIVAAIAGLIAVIKNTAGKISGNEALKNSNLKSEAKNVMDKTAKGISWMEKQWEDAKNTANTESENDTKNDS